MINRISDILKVVKEDDLYKEFYELEAKILETITPLREKLDRQVLTSEVPQIELHMTYVESWRDRASWFNALAYAFVEHAKSSHFILPGGKGITLVEKEAYQKKLVAAFIGLRSYTEDLIKNIDSRVNLCKKLLGIESDVNSSGLRR